MTDKISLVNIMSHRYKQHKKKSGVFFLVIRNLRIYFLSNFYIIPEGCLPYS